MTQPLLSANDVGVGGLIVGVVLLLVVALLLWVLAGSAEVEP